MAEGSSLGATDGCLVAIHSMASRIATAASSAAEQAALESADAALKVVMENASDAPKRLRSIAAEILSRTELIHKETSRFLSVVYGS